MQRDIKVGWNSTGEFWPKMRTILESIAVANRCQAVRTMDSVSLFGFSEDVTWCEMLFTQVMSDFVSKVNPKWDADLPVAANIYNFKVAGYKWADIDRVAMDNGHDSFVTMKEQYNYSTGKMEMMPTKFYHKMHRIYKAHAKKIGDEHLVKTPSHAQYREQFADAYTDKVVERLYGMRISNEQEAAQTTGAELALVDASQRIKEAMWEAYPSLHPDYIAEQNRRHREQMEREAQEREDMLNAMTPAQRRKFLEKEERDRRRTTRGYRPRYVAYQSAAANRGSAAGASVDLTRKRHTSGSKPNGELH